MKNLKFGKSKFSGKGFYIALAISLVAVGSATFMAINTTIKDLNGQTLERPNSSTASEWSFPTDSEQEINKPQSSVPKSSSAPAASKAQPEAPANTEPEKPAVKPTTTTFTMPLNAEVIKEYSKGELVKSETMGDWRTHDAIDIKGDAGTPVKSASDGKVLEIKQDAMLGVCILIDHGNGYVGHYCGLNETVQVKVDQQIAVGDVIGSIGETNQLEISEPQHLHFGLKKDDKWIDPMSVIKTQ